MRKISHVLPCWCHHFRLPSLVIAVHSKIWPLPIIFSWFDLQHLLQLCNSCIFANHYKSHLVPLLLMCSENQLAWIFLFCSGLIIFQIHKFDQNFTNVSPLQFFLLIFMNLMVFLWNFLHLTILHYLEEIQSVKD